jgi:hypothetical protein
MTTQIRFSFSQGGSNLTFVSAIDFGFADKGRRVDFVAAQVHVVWIGDTSAHITCHVVRTSSIMAVVASVSTTAEKAREL